MTQKISGPLKIIDYSIPLLLDRNFGGEIKAYLKFSVSWKASQKIFKEFWRKFYGFKT